MFDHDTTDAAVSRRNVLTTTGGLLVGSAAFAGVSAGSVAQCVEPARRGNFCLFVGANPEKPPHCGA